MLLTRKAEFSASHACINPSWSEAENRKVYGVDANPNGHGHNYVLEVSVEGDPDPVTGMVFDLRELKGDPERRSSGTDGSSVSQPRGAALRSRGADHGERRDRDLEQSGRADHSSQGAWACACATCRLYETPDLYVDYGGEAMRLTCRYRFAASHRLDSPALSAEENRKLYGKCNNPYGHGHGYALDVTRGRPRGCRRPGGGSRGAGPAGEAARAGRGGSQESEPGCPGVCGWFRPPRIWRRLIERMSDASTGI